jgi:hypothetical protein
MGGSSSDSYDAAYNARMATLAEQYGGMAETAFNSWDTGGARLLEEKTAQAGLGLLPAQTELAQGQIDSALSLLPASTELSLANIGLDLEKTRNKSGILGKFYESLGKNNEVSAMNEAGSNMASQFATQEKASTMGLQRRGVTPTANNIGLTADKAKAIGLAQQTALENARATNKQELLTGLTI